MQGTVVHHLTGEGVACDAHMTAITGCKVRVSANAASLVNVLKHSDWLFTAVKLDLVILTVEVKAKGVSACSRIAEVLHERYD